MYSSVVYVHTHIVYSHCCDYPSFIDENILLWKVNFPQVLQLAEMGFKTRLSDCRTCALSHLSVTAGHGDTAGGEIRTKTNLFQLGPSPGQGTSFTTCPVGHLLLCPCRRHLVPLPAKSFLLGTHVPSPPHPATGQGQTC